VAGVNVVRPLLGVPREVLREHLKEIGQPWREDASNASPQYVRNRIRALLAAETELTQPLLNLASACGHLRDWVQRAAPTLHECFAAQALHDLPELLARESARRWLVERGAPPAELPPPVLDRLVRLATDAASPVRQHFPGGILVRRRRGRILAVAPAPAGSGSA
jgi:tRNA(Ile)-lysidine synthase TilS/MesJ